MAKYRSKVVEIEAYQLTVGNIRQMEVWSGGSVKGTQLPVHEQEIELVTHGDEVRACIGDYIIKELDGSGFYPCKPNIFHAKYEAI